MDGIDGAIGPDGSVCGRHRGIVHYTVGQRKHLGVALGRPVYVRSIDPVQNCIYLADSSEDLRKKIMSMYTDPNHLRVEDPGQVEGNPVFLYLDAFCRPEYVQEFMPDYASLDEVKAHYQRGGLGDVKVKKFLNSVMQAELGPIRERRAEWEKRIDDVYDILKSGSEKAEKTARAVLDDVRASMQIDYFTDRKLIDMYRK